MKRLGMMLLVVAAVFFLLPAVTEPVAAQVVSVEATLMGWEEVPAISTSGTGSFMATVDQGAQTITYTLTYSGLQAATTAAHIHLGQRGVSGGVVAFLCGGGDKPACPASGSVSDVVDAADILALPAQGIGAGEFGEVINGIAVRVMYVNVHSSLFPGGEIRGQIRRTP